MVRLGLLAERQVGAETLRHIADRLEEKELLELRENYQRRAAERYPIAPQLSYGNGDGDAGAAGRGFFDLTAGPVFTK